MENTTQERRRYEWLTWLANMILNAYNVHYSFPPQGESHMHDCIVDVLDGALPVEDKPLTPYGINKLQATKEALFDAVQIIRDAREHGCWLCSGDCAGANPPVSECPMRRIDDFLTELDL